MDVAGAAVEIEILRIMRRAPGRAVGPKRRKLPQSKALREFRKLQSCASPLVFELRSIYETGHQNIRFLAKSDAPEEFVRAHVVTRIQRFLLRWLR